MITKKKILEEIKRTAQENGGQPLGKLRFEKETGITSYDWHMHWARFSDAQKEAGFAPNQLIAAYTHEFLIEKVICLMRKLGKFPISAEVRLERYNDSKLPDFTTFRRALGSKQQFAAKIMEYCESKNGYEDIIKLCRPILEKANKQNNFESSDFNEKFGEVYIFKSGKYYKIGKTNDTVRRGKELRIQMPEKVDLIHSIKTDDPTGVESYWQKRFESKCMKNDGNSEWFDLTSSDVKAFKRWRKIA